MKRGIVSEIVTFYGIPVVFVMPPGGAERVADAGVLDNDFEDASEPADKVRHLEIEVDHHILVGARIISPADTDPIRIIGADQTVGQEALGSVAPEQPIEFPGTGLIGGV